jgi:dTDP-4-amino-4,6-dideoxygalactose transaminase
VERRVTFLALQRACPGDRGLTAAITFAASANCLLYAGADAGFVDIDRDALGMTPAILERTLASAPQTKAVIPVHLGACACFR